MNTEWTVESLKEYFDALRQADREAVATALAAAKEAVAIAEANSEKWRDNANEWRGAMSDRERQFMRRDEVRAFVVALVAVASIAVAIVVAVAQ